MSRRRTTETGSSGRRPFDPARRLNIYLAAAGDRERFNAAAEAVGLERDRGTFLAGLLDQHEWVGLLLDRDRKHQTGECECDGMCIQQVLAQLGAARPGITLAP